MTGTLFDKLKRISPWHFIWISIVASELITLFLSVVQGRIWWGAVSRETLIIGAVDSSVVPLIVATLVIYFVKRAAELKRTNEKLEEANQRLQAIDKMKTDIVSVVSHELRAPLTTIKASAELMTMKPAMPGQRREKLLSTVVSETDRLTRLINDLLDLAMIEEGSMRWRVASVSMEDVIIDAATNMGALAESKGLLVTTDIPQSLPPVEGDRDRLLQVMTNLLSNAVKFTPRGGAVNVIAQHETQPKARIVIAVSDTGVGIPDADLEIIFEKFQRSGDQLTRVTEGAGLGLPIAKQIVEHHGGRIWAESEQGRGSTFLFTIPLPFSEPRPAVNR